MLLALLLLGLLVAGAHLDRAPAMTLVASDPVSDRFVLCHPLAPGDAVTLSFTHSMYGGEVRETYLPDDGRLRRVEVTTENAAAAEYYAYTAGVTRDGDRYRVELPVLVVDELVVRVDAVGRHRLTVGHERFDLLTLAGGSAPLRLALGSESC